MILKAMIKTLKKFMTKTYISFCHKPTKKIDIYKEELGKMLGFNRSSISKWENGQLMPLEHLNTYSIYFQKSFDYITRLNIKSKYHNNENDLNSELIGKRIVEIRNNNGLSLRDLAKELNTTSSTISAYETGKVLIQTSFAIEICKKYNVSLDWLCGKK